MCITSTCARKGGEMLMMMQEHGEEVVMRTLLSFLPRYYYDLRKVWGALEGRGREVRLLV